jgi:hypothetical protein
MIGLYLSTFCLLLFGGDLSPAVLTGFVALSHRPSPEDLQCANYSRSEWTVSYENGSVRALKSDSGHMDKLPFNYQRSEDRAGDRYVERVSDGWIVGFDAGEFGGALWWFSPSGDRSERLSPPMNAPAHPKDIFKAENVHGFARYGTDLLVFMGLDHLGGRSGRVFRLVREAGRWELLPFTVLDGTPNAWVVNHDGVVILTNSALWLALSNNQVRKLCSLDLAGLHPNSMVQGSDGDIYIGMRRYVLRLRKDGSNWIDTWFVQSGCVEAKITGYECKCAR